MTYVVGGNIEASDYNLGVTTLNLLYADTNSGATTLPAAGYGYGQTPPLIPVSIGDNIAADINGDMLDIVRAMGVHQGTTTVPPLPVTNPLIGDPVVVYNTPVTFASIVGNLTTNRFNLAPGQTTLTIGTTYTSASSWLTLMTYTFQADFGSWNNARYFFNSGGSLQINGDYPTAVTPIQIAWRDALVDRSPFTFNWNSTTGALGSNDAVLNPIGFWRQATNNPLTTSYQIVYRKAIGAGYYTSSFVEIEAKLAAVAGTNGLVDFRVNLVDGDPTPDTKIAGIEFTVNNARSTGAIVYPGPAVVITSGGFTYT